jgi:hypothetical protein
LKVAFGSIVLKNPSIGFSPKNGRFVASALFGVESAYGEARKLTSRQLLLQAESLGKNSRGSSVASPIVIDPKIGVFQHWVMGGSSSA